MEDKEQFLNDYGEVQYQMTRLKEIHTFAESQRGENFVLSFLLRCQEDVNPKEISKALHVSTARIAAILKKLEASGRIERYQDPHSQRQTLVRILPQGIAHHEEIQNRFHTGASELYDALGEDAAEFLRLQKKLLAYYERKRD